nr:MAG: hypothetical protein [Bacteriophage sp.]
MTRKPEHASIDRLMVEHYLFDLGQSIEKTAEILGKDEKYVRESYDNHIKFTMPIRRHK